MIAIAIDDEPIALDVIRTLVSKVPYVQVEGYFTNAFEGLSYMQNNEIDLLFLDIKMPDITGTDLVNILSNPPMVVFTTAYAEHAVKSFELDAVDYLLKPFSFARFLKACNKANELNGLRNRATPLSKPDYLFVKDGYEQVKVNFDDILFIEAAGNYAKIYLTGEKLLSTRVTLNEMQLLLPGKNFLRTHRAYIIACNKVNKFDRYQICIGEHIIPIGASYAQNINI
jgi:two-component system LytT family response regulator